CFDTDTNNAHCGGCNIPCTSAPNSTWSCDSGSCEFQSCNANYWDLDGNPANGCEYNCVFQSAVDLPDDNFRDANCDGIDGDIAKAIFVSTSGNDANPGTMSQPVRTITYALQLAQTTGKSEIYVAAGEYSSPTVTLVNGISIYGGYSYPSWTRNATHQVTIKYSGAPVDRRIVRVQGT